MGLPNDFDDQTYLGVSVPLSQYVSIPSLECAKNLLEVLDNVSFSLSPIKNDMQCVRLHYREGSSLYTLGWYDIHYDLGQRTTIGSFATANLHGIGSSHIKDSQFAAKLHLLRTPVSGIGSKLFEHLISMTQTHAMPSLKISSDALSVSFYKKMAIKFSEYFTHVDENYTRYPDGGCDFLFVFKQ